MYMHRKPHSEETKRKISSARLGQKLSPEHRAKVIKTLRNGSGESNPNWKGGASLNDQGYILVRFPDHPNARSNGYVPLHRLVMEEKLGRLLDEHEQVHHLDENKLNNHPDNLKIVSLEEHAEIHWKTEEARKAQSELMKKIRSKKFWSTKS